MKKFTSSPFRNGWKRITRFNSLELVTEDIVALHEFGEIAFKDPQRLNPKMKYAFVFFESVGGINRVTTQIGGRRESVGISCLLSAQI